MKQLRATLNGRHSSLGFRCGASKRSAWRLACEVWRRPPARAPKFQHSGQRWAWRSSTLWSVEDVQSPSMPPDLGWRSRWWSRSCTGLEPTRRVVMGKRQSSPIMCW
ncbi:hypothetical protein F751_2213 [Auxenochlorella protothecoides]|uniref:Uncharacterized protein n=1 Tax=Auxenochlorella protothecoides TaxID=3075 RepID=A0A087SLM2_AUXPR|nr:hypothetical protein F751_2213 [Auxenochlorella protothecoides]KFM26626.1 hypothetical protein F751_2213 [Auxenochlorella protothecoides]